MRIRLFLALGLLLFLGTARLSLGAWAAPGVVINEFELNPPGDDYAPGAEFVELYNSGPAPVDVGGWKVVSTHGVPVVVTIPAGVGISPGGFYVVGHSGQWLDNTDEQIILRDAGGVEVDRTPVKSDPFNDARTWQRYPDGAANWVFDAATKMAVNVPEFQQPTFFAAVALIGALALVRKDSRRAKLFGRISCWAVSRPVEKSET